MKCGVSGKSEAGFKVDPRKTRISDRVGSGLREGRQFLTVGDMAISSLSNSGTAPAAKWDEKLIFGALISQPRRKLMFALAVGGPQAAASLTQAGRGKGRHCKTATGYLDRTLKNLKVLINARIVVQLENPQDQRRWLYALDPGLNVTVGESETVFDFDFVVARIAADGN